MTAFHVLAAFARPGLHLWREGTALQVDLRPLPDDSARPGWSRFAYALDPDVEGAVRFLVQDRDPGTDAPRAWEPEAHHRTLPRGREGAFPEAVWLAQGAARVLTADPLALARDRVRVHLITAKRYRDGRLRVRGPEGETLLDRAGEDEDGPFWDVELGGARRQLLQFDFVRGDGGSEPASAARLWVAGDGGELWTHSEAPAVLGARPARSELRLRLRQALDPVHVPLLHLWQEASDFVVDLPGEPADGGWTLFRAPLYSGLPYRALVSNPTLPAEERWEHPEATRALTIPGDADRWTLEGDAAVFEAEPTPVCRVQLTLAAVPPGSAIAAPWFAEVTVNRARVSAAGRVDPAPGTDAIEFQAYPGVVTSVRLRSAAGPERLERHPLRIPPGATELSGHLVAERTEVLAEPPPADLFRDPPFAIERPGAYEADGRLRFALHAPTAARAQVVGEWTGWEREPLEMRSTRDGAYWWAEVGVAELQRALPPSPDRPDGDYHGALYKYRLDGARSVQDPAAGWVESSSPAHASRLLRSSRFAWGDAGWRVPTWDSLVVYQLHPQRFSGRVGDRSPLDRVAAEVDERAGYLRDLGITALLLMPVNEVGSRNSWGYDPAFFYAVETAYGGPEALKRLVDACHRNGLAVLLDVVFNHAGSIDNVLWNVARDSFFAGDTSWGAMIAFAHPQCRHFFEQNLVYLQREFHVDGFRLDHTHTIVHSADGQSWFVRVPGPGGGWEFLHGLRHALRTQAAPGCLLMAEHLPNEWSLTNAGGPMDTQWCDGFHDRLLDACRSGRPGPELRDALLSTHRYCDDWYAATNYAESHDEVGNVDERIANVAGWGRGLRMTKVAAAATMLSRGIPMLFMGAEAGEHRQFRLGEEQPLDLDAYEREEPRRRLRGWLHALCELRRDDSVKGPAPLGVSLLEDHLLVLSRGLASDVVAVLNFGGWAGWRELASLGVGDGRYAEWLNSTWPAFAVEFEDEHPNGGRDARLHRGDWLHVPDHGVVVLRRA